MKYKLMNIIQCDATLIVVILEELYYIREGIKFNKIATVAYDKSWFATIIIEDANL